MAFDPKPHMLQLTRKAKNQKTGQWETSTAEYLEVKWRLVWFRDLYPHGQIETEEIVVDVEQGYARYKARVCDGEGGIGTGYGTETRDDFGDFVEKAETKAIGRALAAMGIGTQFVGEEMSEQERVVDAPVDRTRPATKGQVHPTADQVGQLVELAKACDVDLATFGQHMRRLMDLDAETQVTKKFLRETMTLSQYEAAHQEYTAQLKAMVEAEVVGGEPGEVVDDEPDMGDATDVSKADLKRLIQRANELGVSQVLDDLLKKLPEGMNAQQYQEAERAIEQAAVTS